MKKPLNFAILKYMTTVNEACTEDVLCALKDGYSSFRAFNKSDVLNALLTAEANGLLEESRYDLDDEGQVRMPPVVSPLMPQLRTSMPVRRASRVVHTLGRGMP